MVKTLVAPSVSLVLTVTLGTHDLPSSSLCLHVPPLCPHPLRPRYADLADAHQTSPCLRTFALAAPPALSTAGSLMDLNSPDVTFSVQPSLPRAPLCPACAAPLPLLFSGMPCFLTCSASRLFVCALGCELCGAGPGSVQGPPGPLLYPRAVTGSGESFSACLLEGRMH